MKFQKRKKAVLLLSDGTRYNGYAAGKIGTTTGELCFNTGMTGYQEIFTDPSYYGQMMITTHTHIGNYGAHAEEVESGKVQIAGLIVRNFSGTWSRSDGASSLQEYLEAHEIVAISDIDTRSLVRHIRDKGAMNAILSSEALSDEELKQRLDACPDMEGLELSSKVTTSEPYDYGDSTATYRVAALDLGIKNNILRSLGQRDCFVRVFPADTSLETLEAFEPDGFFLSNGPGDPSAMPGPIETVKQILDTGKPVFGICLGHQLMCLAMEIPTYKMFTGHRGINHAVKNLERNTSEITSQNHGFGVSLEAAEASDAVTVTHINLNDNSLEGIRINGKKAFSVQYHPEASPGPHDSRYLFDQFVKMMEAEKAVVLS